MPSIIDTPRYLIGAVRYGAVRCGAVRCGARRGAVGAKGARGGEGGGELSGSITHRHRASHNARVRIPDLALGQRGFPVLNVPTNSINKVVKRKVDHLPVRTTARFKVLLPQVLLHHLVAVGVEAAQVQHVPPSIPTDSQLERIEVLQVEVLFNAYKRT